MAAAGSSKFSFSIGAREQGLPSRISAGLHASTSAAPCPWLRVRVPGHRHHPTPRRGYVRFLARRRNDEPDWDDDDRQPRKGRGGARDSGGFKFSNRRGKYRVQYNDYEAEVRQEEAWKVLVPVLGGVVLAAAFIGPLIIGFAFTAVALGAALSAGAFFTSLFLPLFIFIGMGALFIGGATFSAFATLGTALLLPKLITMAVVAGGVGLGAMAVSLFLRPAADKAKASYSGSGSRAGKAGGERGGKTIDVGADSMEVEPEGDPEVDRQLREFDELLAGREEQRQRADRWKAGGGGSSGGRRR
ncbi:hypothetical protein PLESTB_001613500 [Pleodorina starrii]|uniref:Uncharacterized protein n=1 Tax=Pleodorina starrii TaxID=330485 RepID=A0A9W6F8K6_9CHLO|nr:hypothetical protein PLESTM_000167200 [Pleodorina starrii]GLC60447.1 hypothetical protein PLESTB_001613500 [Pleodorina starrii]GLC64181.1 hypothetical protein PLESTF_000133300 [Pleodorina starrii]